MIIFVNPDYFIWAWSEYYNLLSHGSEKLRRQQGSLKTAEKFWIPQMTAFFDFKSQKQLLHLKCRSLKTGRTWLWHWTICFQEKQTVVLKFLEELENGGYGILPHFLHWKRTGEEKKNKLQKVFSNSTNAIILKVKENECCIHTKEFNRERSCSEKQQKLF